MFRGCLVTRSSSSSSARQRPWRSPATGQLITAGRRYRQCRYTGCLPSFSRLRFRRFHCFAWFLTVVPAEIITNW